MWHKDRVHTSERHLLFCCFPWLFLIVSASLLWKHNWWVMKLMLPRTRWNGTFYRLVVEPQFYCLAALPAESRRLCCWEEALGCFSGAESSPLIHGGLQSVPGFRAERGDLVPVWSCPTKPGAVALCWVKAVLASTCAAGVQHGCHFIRVSLNLSFECDSWLHMSSFALPLNCC